jgi:hypothetical protein
MSTCKSCIIPCAFDWCWIWQCSRTEQLTNECTFCLQTAAWSPRLECQRSHASVSETAFNNCNSGIIHSPLYSLYCSPVLSHGTTFVSVPEACCHNEQRGSKRRTRLGALGLRLVLLASAFMAFWKAPGAKAADAAAKSERSKNCVICERGLVCQVCSMQNGSRGSQTPAVIKDNLSIHIFKLLVALKFPLVLIL